MIESKEEFLQEARRYELSLEETFAAAKVEYQTLLDCCKRHMPVKILEEIKDLRVFCLGYTSAKVKNLLNDFARRQTKRWECLSALGENNSVEAEEKLRARVRVKSFKRCVIQKIGETKSGVVVWLKGVANTYKLRVKKGEFLEGREDSRFLEEEKNIVVASELYYEKKAYELHLLVRKIRYKSGLQKCWCLTLRGKSIKGM